jgi:hypothetical protein
MRGRGCVCEKGLLDVVGMELVQVVQTCQVLRVWFWERRRVD